MFTFQKQDEQDPIFFVDDKPVYTVRRKDPKLRIKPFRKTGDYLSSEEFRERYNLSRPEAKVLKKALQSDIVPDTNLKGAFYSVRRDLNSRLFTEIDLRNTPHKISWRYPQNIKKFPRHAIIIGSSGSGKTYKIINEIEEALRRPKKRKFIYISPELNLDRTLKRVLNNKRWTKYFLGIDVSDESFKQSERANVEEWWLNDIKPLLDEAEPGTKIIIDDGPDSLLRNYLLTYLIRLLRTGRHKGLGVSSVQHRTRARRWTSQSYSSVSQVTLYPSGGGKGTQVAFLYDMMGIGKKRARSLVDLFGSTSRSMTINMWSPSLIFGDKFATFV
jgi:hypothetical protein